LEWDLAAGARIIAKIYDRMNRIYGMESLQEALGGKLRSLLFKLAKIHRSQQRERRKNHPFTGNF
jgi:hypothetical protein